MVHSAVYDGKPCTGTLAHATTQPNASPTPDCFAWRQGQPPWKPVAGTTYWHYDEHRDSIRVWLGEN